MNARGIALKFVIVLFFFGAMPLQAGEFKQEEMPNLGVMKSFKASELCQVAKNTNTYLNQNGEDTFAVKPGDVVSSDFSLARVKKTLTFLCQTYLNDVRNGRQSRLHNTDFLRENFTFYRWYPDTHKAQEIALKSTNNVKARLLNDIPEDKIFLTKYYTKLLTGSDKRTDEFSQALYALPFDEQGKTIEQAELLQDTLTRFKYTRQQVIAGELLKNNLAKPLVWISEEALHDVLLQGTGVLKIGDSVEYFNVHRNNGIPYNYAIGKSKQPRYWYFSKVPSIMGYGKSLERKIPVIPQVTFAGNVKDLGLGKLILVNYEVNNQNVSRMGVLADQGGAFDDNLFQLDLLVDSYTGWSDYHKANKHLPDYANAWILLLKG